LHEEEKGGNPVYLMDKLPKDIRTDNELQRAVDAVFFSAAVENL